MELRESRRETVKEEESDVDGNVREIRQEKREGEK